MKSLRSKKVSVVVPNYNYAKYIGGRLNSIVKQTYPIYELIILDDASTDDSVDVIKREMAKAGRKKPGMKIRLIRNEKNSGKAIAQWIRGVEEAKGDFVWIAEADDGCSPKFLENVMKAFEDPEVVLSYAESKIFNGMGVMIAPNFRWSRDKEKTKHFAKSYVKDGKDEIQEIMAIRCTIPNVSGVVFRKTPELAKYLKEALKFRQVGDWYLYLKLLEKGKIAYTKRALNHFRIHKGSATARGREHVDEVAKIHKMVNAEYKLDAKIKKWMEAEEKRTRAKYGIID